MARAFIAKAVFQIDTTRALRERLANDRALRRLRLGEYPRARRPSRVPLEFAERLGEA